MANSLTTGQLVVHSGEPPLGLGKVVHYTAQYVYVIFKNVRGREAYRYAQRSPVLSLTAQQRDPVLDNLPPVKEKGDTYVLPAERLTSGDAIAAFLDRFPKGFSDPGYLGDKTHGERFYKIAARQAVTTGLADGTVWNALTRGDLDPIRQLVKGVAKLNLLSPFERNAFHDALAVEAPARRYFERLRAVIEEPTALGQYAAYVGACAELPRVGNSAVFKWPVVTLLPFIVRPDVHMFLKPTVANTAARTLGFDLKYQAKPNMETYEALLDMGHVYSKEIEALAPRDMIDVQSFLWVTCGGYDEHHEDEPGED